jgi:hypothetical protein
MRYIPDPEKKSKKTPKTRPAPRAHGHRSSHLREEDGSFTELQRLAGNQALQSLFTAATSQANLPTTPQDAAAEREADQTAERVVNAQAREAHSAHQQSPQTGAARPSQAGAGISTSSGQPLDPVSRAFFEARFGEDFSLVRIHTGPDATKSARAIDALAYTSGEHIVFDSGQYAPHTQEGRKLIAHELTHTLQQDSSNGRSSPLARQKPSSRIQRQTNPAPPKPQTIPDTAQDQAVWRAKVDAAVRGQFGLTGSALTAANVHFSNESQFAAQFAGKDLEDRLFTIFLNFGQDELTVPGQILDHNNVSYRVLGYRDPAGFWGAPEQDELRKFIQQGIQQGHFAGQSREIDVTTGQRFPVYRVPPKDLAAEFVGGTTTTGTPRAGRQIQIRTTDLDLTDRTTATILPYVHTLVHEACHFYVSDGFRNMVNARQDGGSPLGNARISEVLFEGFAEYFAREVMLANTGAFGPPANSYQAETQQVWRIAAALGEPSLRSAYFGGNSQQLLRLSVAVDLYKDIDPDLQIPDYVVDVTIAQRSATGSKKGTP